MMQVRLFTIRLSSTYLEQDQLSLNSFLETVQFKKSSTQFVEQEEGYWSVLIYYENKESQELEKEGVQFQNLDEQQQRVLAFLKQWRTEKALSLRVKNFMICRNSELIDLALNRPSTLSELERIKGFGKQKIDRFGEELVTLLNAV